MLWGERGGSPSRSRCPPARRRRELHERPRVRHFRSHSRGAHRNDRPPRCLATTRGRRTVRGGGWRRRRQPTRHPRGRLPVGRRPRRGERVARGGRKGRRRGRQAKVRGRRSQGHAQSQKHREEQDVLRLRGPLLAPPHARATRDGARSHQRRRTQLLPLLWQSPSRVRADAKRPKLPSRLTAH